VPDKKQKPAHSQRSGSAKKFSLPATIFAADAAAYRVGVRLRLFARLSVIRKIEARLERMACLNTD
jgi:hypothetical protein